MVAATLVERAVTLAGACAQQEGEREAVHMQAHIQGSSQVHNQCFRDLGRKDFKSYLTCSLSLSSSRMYAET